MLTKVLLINDVAWSDAGKLQLNMNIRESELKLLLKDHAEKHHV